MLPLLTALLRERAFYAERGLPCPKDMEAETEKDEKMKKVSTSLYSSLDLSSYLFIWWGSYLLVHCFSFGIRSGFLSQVFLESMNTSFFIPTMKYRLVFILEIYRYV